MTPISRATSTSRRKAAPAKRAYRSPRRTEQAAQTRAQIIAAAAALFGERGWAATAMRDIAAAAQVSVETVYTHFRSKADVLMGCIDVGIVGDTGDTPIAKRQEFRALAEGTPQERAAAAAALQTQIQLRVVPLHLALRQAASDDAELRRRLDDDEQRRRETIGQAARLIADRPVTRQERDGLWATLSVEVWHLLVERSGWTPQQYQSWLTDLIMSLLHLGQGT